MLLQQFAHADTGNTNQLIEFLHGKTIQLLEFIPVLEVPFKYPSRPTIEMRVGNENYQMLLDSGTRLSILNVLSGETLRAGLKTWSQTAELADLDGRSQIVYADHSLRYASAAYAAAGDLRIRNLPLRIYTYESELPGTDFQGSLALRTLHDAIIEFDNDRETLRIHFDGSFRPEPQSLAVPLLQLQGLWFVEARVGEDELLLLLDTGFSGELLLGSRAISALGEKLTPTGETSDSYAGFHGDTGGELAVLDCLLLQGQAWPGLAERSEQVKMINVMMLPDFVEECALGHLDGMIGAGLLSRFNYTVDQSRSVIYLVKR